MLRSILAAPSGGQLSMKISHGPKSAPLVRFIRPIAVLLVAAIASQMGSAQQTVPFQGGIPVAPLGLAGRPLPDRPVEFDTARGQKIRVVVVTKALEYPWSLAFLPDGTHAGHRARRPASDHPQRRPRSSARRRRAGVLLGRSNPACPAPSTATWTSRFIRGSPRIATSISPTPSRSTKNAERSRSPAGAWMAAR